MWCVSQRNRQSRINAGQPESIQLTRNFPIPLFIFHSKRTEHLLRPFTVSAKDLVGLHFIIVFAGFYYRGNFNWSSILFFRPEQAESARTLRDSVKKGFRFVLDSSRMCKSLPLEPLCLMSPFCESKCSPRHKVQGLHQQVSCACRYIARTPQRKETIFSWTKDFGGMDEKLDPRLRSVCSTPMRTKRRE